MRLVNEDSSMNENVSMKLMRSTYLDFRKQMGHVAAVAATAEYYGLDPEDINDELKAFGIEPGFMEGKKRRNLKENRSIQELRFVIVGKFEDFYMEYNIKDRSYVLFNEFDEIVRYEHIEDSQVLRKIKETEVYAQKIKEVSLDRDGLIRIALK